MESEDALRTGDEFPDQCADGPVLLLEDICSAQQDTQDSLAVEKELDHPIMRKLLTEEPADEQLVCTHLAK